MFNVGAGPTVPQTGSMSKARQGVIGSVLVAGLGLYAWQVINAVNNSNNASDCRQTCVASFGEGKGVTGETKEDRKERQRALEECVKQCSILHGSGGGSGGGGPGDLLAKPIVDTIVQVFTSLLRAGAPLIAFYIVFKIISARVSG